MKTILILILLLLSTLPALAQHKVKLYLPDTVLEYDIEDITSLSFDNNTLLTNCRIYFSDRADTNIMTYQIISIYIAGANNNTLNIRCLGNPFQDNYNTYDLTKIDSIVFYKKNLLFGKQYTNAKIAFSSGINFNLKVNDYVTKSNFDDKNISISNGFGSEWITDWNAMMIVDYKYCFEIDPKGLIFICHDENTKGGDGYSSYGNSERMLLQIYIDTVNLVIDSLIYQYYQDWGDHYLSQNYSTRTDESICLFNIPFIIQPNGTIFATLDNIDKTKINYDYYHYEYSHYGGGGSQTEYDFLNFTDISPDATITIEIKP